MSALDPAALAPLAVTFEFVTDVDFWVEVGVIAGIYALLALGLQLNVGFTGIVNFGQAGFMAVGAYAMAILVLKADFSFWLALPAAVGIAVLFGLIVGLPSLRLRADYFAIATIAMAEMVRLFVQNARELTGGNQGLFCEKNACYDDAWLDVSDEIESWLVSAGWSDPSSIAPLFLVTAAIVLIATVALTMIQKTPWGRVLRAIREDEDAARALGKNTLSYKLQSLAISAVLGALGGFLFALYLATLHPVDFEPLVTFFAYGVLVLGGLASYWGVIVGSVVLWAILHGTRYVELFDNETDQAALRLAIIGVLLIGLMAFRPQGAFGKREEMVLRE